MAYCITQINLLDHHHQDRLWWIIKDTMYLRWLLWTQSLDLELLSINGQGWSFENGSSTVSNRAETSHLVSYSRFVFLMLRLIAWSTARIVVGKHAVNVLYKVNKDAIGKSVRWNIITVIHTTWGHFTWWVLCIYHCTLPRHEGFHLSQSYTTMDIENMYKI